VEAQLTMVVAKHRRTYAASTAALDRQVQGTHERLQLTISFFFFCPFARRHISPET
jgi:hypothetical protein